MTKFIALLRGINVGGKNILPMKEFRGLLSKLGCEGVATYIQSGNAIFRYSGDAAELPGLISGTVESEFGFRPSVMVLSEDEFSAIVARTPFVAEIEDPRFLNIWFMRESATRANLARMHDIAANGEKFLLTDLAFYLHAPNGVGRSKLAGQVEKCLGVDATARNWRTVGKISDLLSALD